MQGFLAVAALILVIILVISRIVVMRKKGITAMKFGEMDKKDFLIPPFALAFYYLVFAGVFDWPTVGTELYNSEMVSWIGVGLCILGVVFFVLSLVSFGQSFRVGIDEKDPGPLITSGTFAISRNPIYTAFGAILLGVFLIVPNWVLLLFIGAATWLVNRQVLREEESLKKIYGEEYIEYCKKVRRYL